MRLSPGRMRLAEGRRKLLGWGAAYPGPAVSTEALCAQIGQRFGLRTERQGRLLGARLAVHQRHLCRDFGQAAEAPRPGARNPELAAEALLAAQARAGLGYDRLAYLISHTCTPARLLPGGSAEIARLAGHQGAHMELRQACTGFANALQMAFALTQVPGAPVGLVGVETGSVYFDPQHLQGRPEQWVNFLQMGDGAAAVVLGPDDGGRGLYLSAAYFGQCQQPPEAGLSLRVGGSDAAWAPGGVISFQHDYASVASHGMDLLSHGRDALAQAGFALDQASLVVPHQASGALAPWLAAQWGLPPDRVCAHGGEVGNLGSASIWAALSHVLAPAEHANKHANNRASDLLRKGPVLFLGAEATQYSYGGFALEWRDC